MIHFYILQVMDSQIDSETMEKMLQNDTISISGGESNADLPVPALDVNSHEDINTSKPFSILDELMVSLPTHNSTHTTMSTTSSTIYHLLSFMITTTAHSTVSTANPTTTLWHQPIAVTLSTSRTPPLHTSYAASPLPVISQIAITEIHHPLPQKNPKLHHDIHNPKTFHSHSTSSPIAPTTSPNLNYHK